MSTLSTTTEVEHLLYDRNLNKTYTDTRKVHVNLDVHDVSDPDSLVIGIGANTMSLASLEYIVQEAKRLLLASEAYVGMEEIAPASKPTIKRYAVQVNINGDNSSPLQVHYVRAYNVDDAHNHILQLFPDCEISHSFLVDDEGNAL